MAYGISIWDIDLSKSEGSLRWKMMVVAVKDIHLSLHLNKVQLGQLNALVENME